MSAETPNIIAQPEEHAAAPDAAEPVVPRPNPEELPAVIEALLFAATQPLSLKRLAALTGDTEPEALQAAIDHVRAHLDSPHSGLMVMEIANGFQLATRPAVADWVLALHKHRRRNPISPAVLETLSIVAYKQPIVRAEIESIRGVDCGGVLRALQDAGLIEVVGQKEVAGRPSLYGTTSTFLKTFGLRSLTELPSLSDLKSILNTPMRGAAATPPSENDTVGEEHPAPSRAPTAPGEQAPA